MARMQQETGHPPSPFLARFHADLFRVSMALAGQALLWRTLSSGSFSDPWPPLFNSIVEKSFWLLAALVLSSSSLAYLFKSIFHFHVVKAEFLDRWRVNYLFAPWIAAILLLQCLLPFRYDHERSSGSGLGGSKFINWGHLAPLISRALWCACTAAVLLLEVKIYGQWFTKGKRFLSTVANPSTHLSLIGNFASAQAAARLNWMEPALFLFSVGIVHYLVVFVTLYQRLPCNASSPARLQPAIFLSIAAPSMASVAWASISGHFDTACKMFHFLSIFLFLMLIVRPTLFAKAMKKFNSAWWAYVFPVTTLALSSAEYSLEVGSAVAHGIRRAMSLISLAMTLALILLTLVYRKAVFVDDTSLFPKQTKVLPISSPTASPAMEEHVPDQTTLEVGR
ncbi:S-type anion channel SLAH4-like [Nymphaea colorata]|nr:S-type anion channel SLAH4-like [Nymphaea colorata]